MEFTLIIEQDEQGLIGSVVELPGCYTQAKSYEELIKNIKEAISLYMETEKPEIFTKFVGIQKVSL